MTLPVDVEAAIGLLLERLDERLPGQLEALYLVGSLALGDYQPYRSDIDFVAVLAEPQPSRILAELHAELARSHPVAVDGIYLRPGELLSPPGGEGPSARAGRIVMRSPDERHAVTWLTLAQKGIALRGRPPGPDWIAADLAQAIAYSRGNLESYWRPWVERRARLFLPSGLDLLADRAIVWGCLGLLRLHALIAAEQLLSKTGAGQYGLAAFPEHAGIIAEAISLRRGDRSGYGSLLGRRRAALELMQDVLADGSRERPERGGERKR